MDGVHFRDDHAMDHAKGQREVRHGQRRGHLAGGLCPGQGRFEDAQQPVPVGGIGHVAPRCDRHFHERRGSEGEFDQAVPQPPEAPRCGVLLGQTLQLGIVVLADRERQIESGREVPIQAALTDPASRAIALNGTR